MEDLNTGMRINIFIRIWKNLIGSILLLLVSSIWALGQQPECIYVHFDKPFYISGETIWFKVNKKSIGFSTVNFINYTQSFGQS